MVEICAISRMLKSSKLHCGREFILLSTFFSIYSQHCVIPGILNEAHFISIIAYFRLNSVFCNLFLVFWTAAVRPRCKLTMDLDELTIESLSSCSKFSKPSFCRLTSKQEASLLQITKRADILAIWEL